MILFIGAMLDLIGYYTDPVCRAMIAMCVPQEELGKVYALVATVEAIEPLFVNQVYASLFEVWNCVKMWLLFKIVIQW